MQPIGFYAENIEPSKSEKRKINKSNPLIYAKAHFYFDWFWWPNRSLAARISAAVILFQIRFATFEGVIRFGDLM